MKVRILGNVKHDGVILEQYEVYDLKDASAEALIKAGKAKAEPKYEKPVAKYTPRKRGTQPGESVEATEPNENPSAIVGKEQKSETSVKGKDKKAKKEDKKDE